MTCEEIKQKIYELDRFRSIGSPRPTLSMPVLFRTEGRTYVVYMLYTGERETLPAGFVFYDLANKTVSDLDDERGAEFLGMPESLFTFECEEPLLDYGSVPEDETAFDPVIESAEPDPDRYHTYLREMLPAARPLSRKFYRWFLYSI